MRYLFIAAVVCAVLSMLGLRYNHQHSVFLRNQVLAQDQAELPVADDLESLRRFVFKHMNSSMKVELKYSYDRAVAKANAGGQIDQSGELYLKAQAHCDQQGVSSVAQAECVQDYLEARLEPGQNPTPLRLPEKSRYVYTFVSPTWTPDLAGLGLLGAFISMLGAVLAYGWRHLRARLDFLRQS